MTRKGRPSKRGGGRQKPLFAPTQNEECPLPPVVPIVQGRGANGCGGRSGRGQGGREVWIPHQIVSNAKSPLVLRRKKPYESGTAYPACGRLHSRDDDIGACGLWKQYFTRSGRKSLAYHQARKGQGPTSPQVDQGRARTGAQSPVAIAHAAPTPHHLLVAKSEGQLLREHCGLVTNLSGLLLTWHRPRSG